NLLRSYEIERRQVGERNVGASRYAALGRRKWRAQYHPQICDPTPAGEAVRENLIRVAKMEQPKSNEMIGAELGYRYVGSPIVMDTPGGPEHLFREYRPTTWPGGRLPHVWLNDGTPIQDRIAEGYTVLRLGNTNADTRGLEHAIKDHGAPVTTVDIPEAAARDLYQHDIILLRPDLHIVWRGNRLPHNVRNIAATATGHVARMRLTSLSKNSLPPITSWRANASSIRSGTFRPGIRRSRATIFCRALGPRN